ncbi:MAG: porin family protein [Vicinamibacteria bacterium]|nr:porin family protein [Vicinamibacteria bacterium]
MRIRTLLMTTLATLALTSAVWAAPKAASDEKKASFDVHGNWGEDTDFGVGARATLKLDDVYKGVEVQGGFDYYFPSTEEADDFGVDFKYWEINANVLYNLPMQGQSSIKPYVGAGLCYAHASGSASVDMGSFGTFESSASDNQIGLNLIGVIKIQKNLFVEAKYEIQDGSQFVVTAGFRF